MVNQVIYRRLSRAVLIGIASIIAITSLLMASSTRTDALVTNVRCRDLSTAWSSANSWTYPFRSTNNVGKVNIFRSLNKVKTSAGDYRYRFCAELVEDGISANNSLKGMDLDLFTRTTTSKTLTSLSDSLYRDQGWFADFAGSITIEPGPGRCVAAKAAIDLSPEPFTTIYRLEINNTNHCN